jgi:hypothetical protein
MLYNVYTQQNIDITFLLFFCLRPLVMDTTTGDDEAPKDPGIQQTHYQSFSEKDFEGEY